MCILCFIYSHLVIVFFCLVCASDLPQNQPGQLVGGTILNSSKISELWKMFINDANGMSDLWLAACLLEED